jgi:hypothetical protein
VTFQACYQRGLLFVVLGGCSTASSELGPPVVFDAGLDGARVMDADARMNIDAGLGLRDADVDAQTVRSIDLRSYFPSTSTTRSHCKRDGSFYARYTVLPADANFQTAYDAYLRPIPPKPGALFVWQKAYYNAQIQPPKDPFVATYAMLFFGTDQSVTEAGDYLSNGDGTFSVFGYRDAVSQPSGLLWSGQGGLRVDAPARIVDLNTGRQDAAGAFQVGDYVVYSHIVLDVLPAFTPKYGNAGGTGWRLGGAKTYKNVAHLIFHHGVRNPGQTTFTRCPSPSPADAYTALYRSEPGYNSYASDYYLAPGLGIIQEGFLYNEQNSYFGANTDCTGLALSADRSTIDAYLSYVEDF